MPTIESIVRQINKELVPQFEESLRSYLAHQDKEWLIEQIVRLTLDAHSLEEMDRKHFREEETQRRFARAKRVKALRLNLTKLHKFLKQYKKYDRDLLTKDGFLKRDAPPKGSDLIIGKYRSPKGNDLLAYAKDMLYGLLFGDGSTNTSFHRTQRELLTIAVPRMKVKAIDFMKATTEFSAAGTWQDPKGAANDMRADNVILEVEYGEIEGEVIGDGVILALSLINNLEINEEILYGRMENIEQSTLIK
jgi:hypothetical protein